MFRPNTKNLKVLTPDGYKRFGGIQRLDKECCDVLFDDGRVLGCSVKHPVCTNAFGNDYTKAGELEAGQRVWSEDGYIEVVSVTPTGKREVYDLVNVEDTVCYYTDGILSHNCIFIDKGTSSVSFEVLKKIERDACDPLEWFDEFLWPIDDEEGKKHAAFRIWELPVLGRIYSLGADVSSGVGRSNSTICVLDITDLTDIRQVAEYASNTVHSTAFKNIIIKVANMYGVPNMLVERNNEGNGVCDAIAEDPTFQNRLVNYNPLKDAEDAHLFNLPGVTNHKNTKGNLVNNARYWLNELLAVTVRSLAIKAEMETFGKKKNGTWGIITEKDNVRDDRLIALYYALFVLTPDIADQYLDILTFDQNDMPSEIGDPLAPNLEGSMYAGKGNYSKRGKAPVVHINPNAGAGGTSGGVGNYSNEEQELRDWLFSMD